MRLLDVLNDSSVYARGIVEAIGADQRELPTPCAEFTRQVPYADAFDTVLATIRRNWTPDRLSDTFALPYGDATGSGITEFMVVELLGHGWDLAVATGQSTAMSPDLAEAGLAVAQALDEGTLRSPGMMGPAIPVDAQASAVDRLVAFLGRAPRTATAPRSPH